MNEKNFRAAFQTGKIHNMKAHCHMANRMKNGNWQDYYSYEEAASELKFRGKTPVRCKACDWKNVFEEENK